MGSDKQRAGSQPFKKDLDYKDLWIWYNEPSNISHSILRTSGTTGVCHQLDHLARFYHPADQQRLSSTTI